MGTSALPVITYGQRISVYLHFAWRYVIPAVLLVGIEAQNLPITSMGTKNFDF